MFPTSSSTFLVGRNARSATARITLSVLPGSAAPPAAGTAKPTRTRLPKTNCEPSLHRRRQNRHWARCWYVQPRCERVENEDAVASSPRSRRALALSACGGRTGRMRQEPRASFPCHGRGRDLPHLPAARAAHAHGDRGAQHGAARRSPTSRSRSPTPRYGTTVQAFAGYRVDSPGSRATRDRCGSSTGRRARAPTAVCKADPAARSPRTRTRGRWDALAPGQTATFVWGVTAVVPGTHIVPYEVAAGLNGRRRRAPAAARIPTGTFKVNDHPAAPAGLRQQQRARSSSSSSPRRPWQSPAAVGRPYELLDDSQRLIPPSTAYRSISSSSPGRSRAGPARRRSAPAARRCSRRAAPRSPAGRAAPTRSPAAPASGRGAARSRSAPAPARGSRR